MVKHGQLKRVNFFLERGNEKGVTSRIKKDTLSN
jgi:hypothetical protein